MLATLGELAAVGIAETQYITGKFDNRYLHPQANPQIGNVIFSGMLNRPNLAFHPAVAKTTGHQNAVDTIQNANTISLDSFRVDIAHVNFSVSMNTRVFKRFIQRLIGVQQLHVLADHGDGQLAILIQIAVDNRIPLRQVSGRTIQSKALDNQLVQPLSRQQRRNAIDGIHIAQGNNCAGFHIGEQRNFLAAAHINFMIRAAQQYIGLQADRAQLFYRVLSRFGFGFACGGNIGH